MADRSFWPTALVGVGSAALAAVSTAQPWAKVPSSATAAEGSDVAPVALALSLVALAAWGAVLVTRRLGRKIVAGLGLAASLGAASAVAVSRDDAVAEANLLVTGLSGGEAGVTGWYYVAALTAVAAAATFAIAVARAAGWPEMGAKYDSPGGTPTEQTDLWKAIDEGEDPTL